MSHDADGYAYFCCHKYVDDLYALGVNWVIARHGDTFVVGPHADVDKWREPNSITANKIHATRSIQTMASYLHGYIDATKKAQP